MTSRLPMPSSSPSKCQKRPMDNDENKVPLKAARLAALAGVGGKTASPLEMMRANKAFRKSPSIAQQQAAKSKRRSIRTLTSRKSGSGQESARAIGGRPQALNAGGSKMGSARVPLSSRTYGGVAGSQASRRPLSDLCRPTMASRNRSSGQGSQSVGTRVSGTGGGGNRVSGSREQSTSSIAGSNQGQRADADDNPPVKRRRAAWDLKGQLEDMKNCVQKQKMQINKFTIEKTELSESAEQHCIRWQEADQEVHQLKEKMRTKTSEFDRVQVELSRLQAKYATFQTEYQSQTTVLTRQRDDFELNLEASQIECKGLKATIACLTSAQAGAEAQLNAAKASVAATNDLLQQRDAILHERGAEIERLGLLVEEQTVRIRNDETTRRKLHNTIQELKGNIRVFCRVRPLLPNEITVSRASTISGLSLPVVQDHIHFPDADDKSVVFEKSVEQTMNESSLNATKLGGNNRLSKFEFTFDRVFGPNSKQTEVFEEISQLVQSALDGYNVCIFAYGQTGSGKTYTMEGPNPTAVCSDPDKAGMIPLAVQQVFKCTKELEYNSWNYKLEASFVEIYNETIRDLLEPKEENKKCDIKMVDKDSNEIFVSGLTTMPVTSVGQVQKLLKLANDSRAVAATKCNDRSSRSHSVFRLRITGENSATGENCEGMLNLVDLAGSERLKESEAEGVRLKETQHINTSLSTLSQVIMALAKKDPHIPYRNSKLTYLLQNSLGGNSKTLMFVNISPKEEHFNESIISLRFATKVNQCHIGTASKRVK